MRLHGRLSAIEDEWHIRGIPEWLDPVFTFQRTWYPNDIRPYWERESFNPTLAKVFAVVGAGLLGYFVYDRTGNKVYTGLAGAGGFILTPLLVAAYDKAVFEEPVGQAETVEEGAQVDAGGDTNTYTETGTETTPTLVPASPDVKAMMTAARQLPLIRAAVAYKQDPLI